MSSFLIEINIFASIDRLYQINLLFSTIHICNLIKSFKARAEITRNLGYIDKVKA